jgi:multiple sugar transport system permease protein
LNTTQSIDTKNEKRGLSEQSLKWLLLAPTLIIIAALVLYPFFWAVVLSFTEYSILRPATPIFIGIKNYQDLLNDPLIWERFAFTGRFVFTAVLIELAIGFGMAFFLNSRFKDRGILVTLLLLPMMLSPVIVGLFWKYILANNWGIINYYIRTLLHMKEVLWLSDLKFGFWAITIVDIWMWTPFMMLLCLAGLSAVPDYLYESAEVDRASGWFKFTRITLPLAAPLVMLAVVFRVIDCFKTVDIVWVLTAGGPGNSTETIGFTIYKLAFAFFQTGKASALAVIMLVMVIGLSNILIKVLNNARAAAQ